MSDSESINSMGYADFGRKLQVICSKNSSTTLYTVYNISSLKTEHLGSL